jgi:hypothetical protein
MDAAQQQVLMKINPVGGWISIEEGAPPNQSAPRYRESMEISDIRLPIASGELACGSVSDF